MHIISCFILVQKLNLWRKRTEVLKHEVIEKLRTANGLEKLELIDTLHHLGISYNLNKEIDDVMEKIYKTYDIDAPFDNLSTLALRFRLLRQNGWNVSSSNINIHFLLNLMYCFLFSYKLKYG